MNQMTSFSAKLRELRLSKGLTIAELADSIGVSRPTIWSWESARSKPRSKSLTALVAALGTSAAEVLTSAESEEVDAAHTSPARVTRARATARRGSAPLADRSVSFPSPASARNLADVINQAKEEIAHFAGTEAGKVRIIVEI